MATFIQRMIGAAKLNAMTYEEVEADHTALGQALGVVVLSSIATGIGGAAHSARGIVGSMIVALVGWCLWAGLTYFIGTKLLPTPQTEADWGQLLRTTGFAASPGILRVVGVLPLLSVPVTAITGLWMLACVVVAVRQALDYTSTLRSVGVCLIGWAIYGLLPILFVRTVH